MHTARFRLVHKFSAPARTPCLTKAPPHTRWSPALRRLSSAAAGPRRLGLLSSHLLAFRSADESSGACEQQDCQRKEHRIKLMHCCKGAVLAFGNAAR